MSTIRYLSNKLHLVSEVECVYALKSCHILMLKLLCCEFLTLSFVNDKFVVIYEETFGVRHYFLPVFLSCKSKTLIFSGVYLCSLIS